MGEGHATGGVAIPFLLDVEAHISFLVAVPLLIAAELFVQERVRPVPQLFLERRLVPEAHVPRFLQAVAAACRLRARSSPRCCCCFSSMAWA